MNCDVFGRDDSYTVLDYCPRNMIQVEEYVRTEKPTGKSVSEMSKNLILLTMLQNHENKTVEMVNFFIQMKTVHARHLLLHF